MELINTIQKYYGQSFDSGRYLDRFFDLRLDLPQIDNKKYLESKGFTTQYKQDSVALAVINHFGLEMREITRYLKLLRISVYKPGHEYGNLGDTEALCIYYFIPVLLGLKLYDTKKYFELINGKDYSPLTAILSQFKNHKSFLNLLTKSETYEKSGEQMTVVKFDDKIKEAYNCIFNTIYDSSNNYKNVGETTFTIEDKTMIEETINLFSSYADIS